MRGSDPDAALYYLARMLDAGEDPLFLARRVVRMASEDIGLADPQALVVANAAKDAYDFLGSPEGELAIAEAVVYVATAPKSNALYTAFHGGDAISPRATGSPPPPKAILNAPTKLMREEGYGDGYATTTTSPTPSAARTTGPKRSAGARSTTRSNAASSAKSASGWSGGRSSGASAGRGERRRRGVKARRRVCRRESSRNVKFCQAMSRVCLTRC